MRARVLLVGADWCGDILMASARALANLGADVAIVPTNVRDEYGRQLTAFGEQCSRLRFVGQAIKQAAERASFKRLYRQIREDLSAALRDWRPNMLLSLVDGHYPVFADLLSEHPKVTKVAWMMDDPFTFFGPWSRGLHLFDAIYAVEESAVVGLRLATARPVRTLPLAADPQVHHPLPRNGAASYPIAFVGKSYGYSTAGLARASMLNHVRELGLSIWGDEGWKSKLSPDAIDLSEHYRGGPIAPDVANKIYNRASITININHPQIRHGTNLRTFAICSAGAFQLVDWRPGLDDMLEPNREVVSFRSGEELVELAKHFLSDDVGRERIASAGLQRVLSEHTYVHRLREMTAELGLFSGTAPSGGGSITWLARPDNPGVVRASQRP